MSGNSPYTFFRDQVRDVHGASRLYLVLRCNKRVLPRTKKTCIQRLYIYSQDMPSLLESLCHLP